MQPTTYAPRYAQSATNYQAYTYAEPSGSNVRQSDLVNMNLPQACQHAHKDTPFSQFSSRMLH